MDVALLRHGRIVSKPPVIASVEGAHSVACCVDLRSVGLASCSVYRKDARRQQMTTDGKS